MIERLEIEPRADPLREAFHLRAAQDLLELGPRGFELLDRLLLVGPGLLPPGLVDFGRMTVQAADVTLKDNVVDTGGARIDPGATDEDKGRVARATLVRRALRS
jgi:hypothetical protein